MEAKLPKLQLWSLSIDINEWADFRKPFQAAVGNTELIECNESLISDLNGKVKPGVSAGSDLRFDLLNLAEANNP